MSEGTVPRVFVVDDHAMVRSGVRAELGDAVEVDVVLGTRVDHGQVASAGVAHQVRVGAGPGEHRRVVAQHATDERADLDELARDHRAHRNVGPPGRPGMGTASGNPVAPVASS